MAEDVPDAEHVVLTATRLCNATNRTSVPVRHGTWYGAVPAITDRYLNADRTLCIGGTDLVTGTIRAASPYVIGMPASCVLYDLWETLPFGRDLCAIRFAKEPTEIRRLTKRHAVDREDLLLLSRLPDFIVKTALAERIAAAWCRDQGHDLLVIRVDGENTEFFDFESLFREDGFGDNDDDTRIQETAR
jgi:hypothetical protein